jgi:hypothetical protein
MEDDTMLRKLFLFFSLFVIPAALIVIPLDVRSQTADPDEVAHLKAGHKKVEGEVTDVKSGLTTIKTSTGSTYTLNENAALRHGHGTYKVGDKVTLWVNEGNLVMDAHPTGQAGKPHQFVSGKLLSLDNAKSQIKLSTSQGEKSYKLKPESRMFRDIAVGSSVTIELNEAGEVIDLHKDKDQG